MSAGIGCPPKSLSLAIFEQAACNCSTTSRRLPGCRLSSRNTVAFLAGSGGVLVGLASDLGAGCGGGPGAVCADAANAAPSTRHGIKVGTFMRSVEGGSVWLHTVSRQL